VRYKGKIKHCNSRVPSKLWPVPHFEADWRQLRVGNTLEVMEVKEKRKLFVGERVKEEVRVVMYPYKAP
jgi:hypothetical protein